MSAFSFWLFFTVPTTCSRPSTKMSALSFWFFFFFFFPFSVPGALARAWQIKNSKCPKKVLCLLKTCTSVYDNFSREYLVKILSGNVCKRVPCKISNQNGVDVQLVNVYQLNHIMMKSTYFNDTSSNSNSC